MAIDNKASSHVNLLVLGRLRLYFSRLARYLNRIYCGSMSRSVPLIMQQEASDCGLACLAMLLQQRGVRCTVSGLRSRFDVSNRGIKLSTLIEIANDAGLEVEPLHVPDSLLGEMPYPSILFWGGDHFVVYDGCRNNTYLILDPARGKLNCSEEEVKSGFTGFALSVSGVNSNIDDHSDRENKYGVFKTIFESYRKLLVTIFVYALGLELFLFFTPIYLQMVIDRIQGRSSSDTVLVLCSAFVVVVVLNSLASYFRRYYIADLTRQLSIDALSTLYQKLQKIDLKYFRNNYVGSILARFTSFALIQRTLSGRFVQIIFDFLMVFGTMAIMFYYIHSLALMTLLMSALLIYLRIRMCVKANEIMSERYTYSSLQSTYLTEQVRNAEAMRMYGQRELRDSLWYGLISDQFRCDFRVEKYNSLNTALSTLFIGIDLAITVYVLSLSVMESSMTLGAMVAYMAFRATYALRVAALSDMLIEFQSVVNHSVKVRDLIEYPNEECSPEYTGVRAQEVIQARGGSDMEPVIRIRGSAYRHSSFDEYVFKNVDFHVNESEIVAIAGDSGSGKSTLVKIICGLIDMTNGRLLCRGKLVVDREMYRSQFAVVQQNDSLFIGTLAENISFFDVNVDEERIAKAAKGACIHDFIESLPMSFATRVVNPNADFSGGQKQRILLARAFYKRPEILVMDEATSHLDSDNERMINANVRKLGITTVLVAHRLETIRSADRVYNMPIG